MPILWSYAMHIELSLGTLAELQECGTSYPAGDDQNLTSLN